MAHALMSPLSAIVAAAPAESLLLRSSGSKQVAGLPAFSGFASRRSKFSTAAARRVQAFGAKQSSLVRASTKPVDADVERREDDVFEMTADATTFLERTILFASVSLTPLLLDVEAAFAKDGEYGALEGRLVALVHPVVMGSLFAFTLWAGYLGWQWRRVRTIGDDISALKKQIPAAAEGAPASPLEAEVAKLTEERKALTKGGFRDRHFNAGSILLGTGVTISIAGCLNTFLRTGKLFPGPHLYAGAGITVLWALAAALVPAMQKGSTTARNAHIILNALNVALFVWQIPTGLEIVSKVLNLPWV